MRLALVALAASLVLSGCGEKQATGNTNALDEAVSAEDFAANDATAIDAATGADANMAADVDINEFENAAGNESVSGSGRSSFGRPRGTSPSNEAAPEPAAPVTEPANTTDTNAN